MRPHEFDEHLRDLSSDRSANRRRQFVAVERDEGMETHSATGGETAFPMAF